MAPRRRGQLHDQRAGHHQRFFVGDRDRLAGFQGQPGPVKPGGPDDGGHHDVDFRIPYHCGDAVNPSKQARPARPFAVPQPLCGFFVSHRGVAGLPTFDLGVERFPARVSAEANYFQAILQMVDHVEAIRADRSCRPKHHHAAPAPTTFVYAWHAMLFREAPVW